MISEYNLGESHTEMEHYLGESHTEIVAPVVGVVLPVTLTMAGVAPDSDSHLTVPVTQPSV